MIFFEFIFLLDFHRKLAFFLRKSQLPIGIQQEKLMVSQVCFFSHLFKFFSAESGFWSKVDGFASVFFFSKKKRWGKDFS